MKYQIRSLAGGGGFATFTPILHTPPTPQGSSSSEQGTVEARGSSIIDDEMLDDLYKENGGLVNDVNQLVAEMIQLENSSKMPFMNQDNRGVALKFRAKLNEIKQNKEYWKSAIIRAKEQGGLGEVAIDTYGRVFAKGPDNKVVSMSLSEYSKKSKKIKPLTVQELMYERQYNPSLTGQNGLFTVADNAIGINKITTNIKSLIAALGTETIEDSKTYSKQQAIEYANQLGLKKPSDGELEGVKLLQDIISTPGDYVKIKTKTATEKNHLSLALDYIWSTLGEPSQQKLRATAIMNGVNDPKTFIQGMLVAGTDHLVSNEASPTDIPGTKASKDSGDKPKLVNLSVPELFWGDRFYTPGMTYEINNPTAGVTMNVTATGVGPLYSIQKNGQVVSPGAIKKVFGADNYQAIVDPSKAFIGNERIDPTEFSEIAYTGEQIGKVYLPVNPDGTPDLSKMDKFGEAYKIFDENKDKWTKLEAENFFKSQNFSGVHIKEIKNSDNTITKVIGETGTVKPFMAMPIITNSASDISDNPWMTKMIGEEAKRAELLMRESFSVWGGTAKKPKIVVDMPKGFFSLETPYKGVLFVALRPEANVILSSVAGNFMGQAPDEQDLFRNLNHSGFSNGPIGIQSSSDVLVNPQ